MVIPFVQIITLLCFLLLQLCSVSLAVSLRQCEFATKNNQDTNKDNIKQNSDIISQCQAQQLQLQHQPNLRYMPRNESIYFDAGDNQYLSPNRSLSTFSPLCLVDSHRDGRFCKDLSVPMNKRQRLLTQCLQAFAHFADEHHLPYWLNHGGLIGWYFNEQLLPWDMDIDISVLYSDLLTLYTPLHQTTYRNRYLFEVNPNSPYRLVQKTDVIDARFIDKASGLYIDITAVSYIQNTGVLTSADYSNLKIMGKDENINLNVNNANVDGAKRNRMSMEVDRANRDISNNNNDNYYTGRQNKIRKNNQRYKDTVNNDIAVDNKTKRGAKKTQNKDTYSGNSNTNKYNSGSSSSSSSSSSNINNNSKNDRGQPGLYCKSPHYYHPDEVFPLQRGNFSGAEIWLPQKPLSILSREYPHYRQSEFHRGKRLLEMKYGETVYVFDEHQQLWLRKLQ